MMNLTKALSDLPHTDLLIFGESYNLNLDTALYYVVSGTADIFIKRKLGEQTEVKGIFRNEKETLFMGYQSDATEILTAKNSYHTVVLKIKVEQLNDLPLENKIELAKLIDDFIINITRLVKVPKLSKSFINLSEGKQLPISSDINLSTARRVKWLRLIDASAYFNSDDSQPLSENTFFPITRLTWVNTQSAGLMDVIDSTEHINSQNIYADLIFYYKYIFELIKLDIENSDLFENILLFEKIDHETASLKYSFQNLLQYQSYRAAPDPSHKADDPLYVVLLKICVYQKMGISPISNKFLSLALSDRIKEIAYHSRFGYRVVTLPTNWYKEDHGALLTFDHNNKPYAAIPDKHKTYTLHDASNNKTNDFEKIKSKAYYIYKPLPARLITLKDIIKHAFINCSKEIMQVISLSVLLSSLAVILPIITKILFDNVIPYANMTLLNEIFIVMFVVTIAIIYFELLKGVILLRLQSKIDYKIQSGLWFRILQLPISFFQQHVSGDLLNRVMRLIELSQTVTESNFSSAIMTFVFSISSVLVMIYFSPALTGLILIYFLMCASILSILIYIRLKLESKNTFLQGNVSTILTEIISGIYKIKLVAAEPVFFSFWANKYSAMRAQTLKTSLAGSYIKNLLLTLPLLSMALIYTLIYFFSGETSFTAGDFLGFMAAYGQFSFGFFFIINKINNIITIIPLAKRLSVFYQNTPESHDNKETILNLHGEIEVNNISFQYKGEKKYILDQVNFKINSGRFVAIVGGSGSGKSTLLRLLMGYEKPNSGAIFYDHKDLSVLDMESLRRKIGVVLQGDSIFPGTIFSNLSAYANINSDQAWELLKSVGLYDDVYNMPMQLQTMITLGGGTLSGGQAQRLLIARALANKPSILFLDEATSALDNISQNIVMKSLYNLKITRIIIAHRLTTIKFADEILVVKNGTIIERGTYTELLKLKGVFSQLSYYQEI